jgi:hypothetical protein
MNRRRLLTTLALGGAFCAGWTGRARAWLAPAARLEPGAALLTLLSTPESAAAVGRAYLSSHPAEAHGPRLADRLAAGMRSQGCEPAQASSEELRAALSRQIRADFAQGQVVHVEGWVLSVSEARLCGLAALSAPVA